MELCDETVVFKDPRMGFFACLIAEYLDDSIAPILGQNYKASW